jgi:RNA polymerase sigma factor (sigma-70 family)
LVTHPSELLTENLALIGRAVAFACRRYRFDPADAEEFASIVNLRLIENDYAILRTYASRSKFSTWISVVVQRMALDYRISLWGKWRPSAEAKRLGALALDLERLLHRDGRSLDEALVALVPKYPEVTRASLQAIERRLPERAPRHRQVALDEAELVAQPPEADDEIEDDDRQRVAGRLSEVMSDAMDGLPQQDRLILQLRFMGGMTVAQIARMLQLDQKLLYRRIEHHIRDMRALLDREGLERGDIVDLIGREGTILDFDLRKRAARPSIAGDERATAQTEESE